MTSMPESGSHRSLPAGHRCSAALRAWPVVPPLLGIWRHQRGSCSPYAATFFLLITVCTGPVPGPMAGADARATRRGEAPAGLRHEVCPNQSKEVHQNDRAISTP
jgi:hypothetical protein